MIKALKYINIAILLAGITFSANGQMSKQYPRVGDHIEDHTFTELDNFPQKTLKVSEMRGKWLVIDFWSYYCPACIASFPKMNDLHNQFKEKVQLIMVGGYSDQPGSDKYYRVTKEIFNKKKKDLNLQFTVAFDSIANRLYYADRLPYILVVNPEGVIVAKTTRISENQLFQLMEGKKPAFERAYSLNEAINHEESLPLLTNGIEANSGVDTAFSFRSMLISDTKHIPYFGSPYLYRKVNNPAVKSGRLEVKATLKQLYLTAYFGSPGAWEELGNQPNRNEDVILELKDTSNFLVNSASSKGYYAYSLKVPLHLSNTSFLMKIMQSDLNNYFNYDVSIEKRKMKLFHLVVIDPIKARSLKTKGAKMQYRSGKLGKYFGIGLINSTVDQLVNHLQFRMPRFRDTPYCRPLINKTGIDYKIDIVDGSVDLENMYSINEILEKKGLKIIEVEEDAETLVLRD